MNENGFIFTHACEYFRFKIIPASDCNLAQHSSSMIGNENRPLLAAPE
jgi:hypothetical protein